MKLSISSMKKMMILFTLDGLKLSFGLIQVAILLSVQELVAKTLAKILDMVKTSGRLNSI